MPEPTGQPALTPADIAWPWPGQLCGAKHHGMICDRQQGHQGDHVDIYGPLPDHTWTDTDAIREPATPPAQTAADGTTDPGAREATPKRPESLSDRHAPTEGTHP